MRIGVALTPDAVKDPQMLLFFWEGRRGWVGGWGGAVIQYIYIYVYIQYMNNDRV